MKALLSLALMVLGFGGASVALAHGEFDDSMLAEFYLHLDDLEDEVNELIADINAIAADDEATTADVDAFIEHWEDVGVHSVIETHATITYPGVWSAIVALKSAVTTGDDNSRAAAAEQLKSALWQGYGAVRMAASQVKAKAAKD